MVGSLQRMHSQPWSRAMRYLLVIERRVAGAAAPLAWAARRNPRPT